VIKADGRLRDRWPKNARATLANADVASGETGMEEGAIPERSTPNMLINK